MKRDENAMDDALDANTSTSALAFNIRHFRFAAVCAPACLPACLVWSVRFTVPHWVRAIKQSNKRRQSSLSIFWLYRCHSASAEVFYLPFFNVKANRSHRAYLQSTLYSLYTLTENHLRTRAHRTQNISEAVASCGISHNSQRIGIAGKCFMSWIKFADELIMKKYLCIA